MRTSEQLYHQIRWDSRFQAADYALGIQIRNGPVQELPLLSFQPNKDIPWHRILYIKGPQGLVWDRATGLDQLTNDLHSPLQWPLDIILWNVCAGKHGSNKHIPQDPYHIRVLLEAGDEFCHNLAEGNYRYRHQEMLVDLHYPPQKVVPVNLSPGKDALLIQYPELQVAVAHFTSNYRQPNHELRNQQWRVLQPHLKAPWLLLGDLNAADQELQSWPCQDLTPPTPSYKNRRYQRILCSPDLDGQAQTQKSELSDHHPITAQILKPERSYQHALAILPPPYQPIQDIRRLNDPAYDRWPPHLNLVFPGPSQPNYDRLRLALADIQRFTVRFKKVECFDNKTYYWAPEDPAPFHQLTDALGYPRITPHLTLSKKARPRLEAWEFEVLSVDHLENQTLKHSIPLRKPHPAYDRIRHRCKALQVGSSLYLDNQDLDLVTLQLPQPLPEERQLPSLIRGLHYDLADASHWQAVEDRDALFTYTQRDFPEKLAKLYKQLHKTGLKGQAWGLPGGLAWAVILATRASDFTRPIGLHRHDPSGKPMTVWSPHPPGTNLTAHVPKEFLAILKPDQEYEPQKPYLDIRASNGMELIMDLLRQFKAQLRPFVHEDGCYLSLRNVDPERALQHARKLGYKVSLRDG
ncbi:MAG: DUF504 domain-containing protein [Candidatus Eremiobacteraeota bacterium]|nr:DUF504 domain-containing protein [Candidatus Eremiobacteraeota bacterium]MCW5868740.1 DUF504 domain-containing protein [Candidatus Eremiobacteraeota bacterium]